jgi:hypothetical protein
MIQKFLTKYWLSFHVLALFVAISLVIFGVAREGAAYIFWLALFAIEALVVLPTVFKSETLLDARSRVLRSLEDDAFTYVGLILVGLVCIQWLNSGCTLVYFPDADVWKYSMPHLEWLPYSIEPRPALALLSVVVALFAGVLVIRNGLGKNGRRFFLEAGTIIGGVIAAFCVFKSHVGVEPYAGWAQQPGVCNLGAFFAFWFLIASGRDLDFPKASPSGAIFRGMLWWVFAFAGNLIGILHFSTPIGVLVYSGVGVLVIIYRVVMLVLQRVSIGKRFRFVLGILLSLALIAGAIIFLVPSSPVKEKMTKVSDASLWADFTASRQLRTTAAMKIWEAAPWTGVGPQGFSYYLGTVIEDQDWKLTKADRRYVWNDALQFLCEWGVIGSGLLLAIVIILLIPLFIRLKNLFSRHLRDAETKGDLFLSLDSYLVPGLVAIVTLLVYGYFSSLFQYSVTFLSWFFVLALLPGLLPSHNSRKID